MEFLNDVPIESPAENTKQAPTDKSKKAPRRLSLNEYLAHLRGEDTEGFAVLNLPQRDPGEPDVYQDTRHEPDLVQFPEFDNDVFERGSISSIDDKDPEEITLSEFLCYLQGEVGVSPFPSRASSPAKNEKAPRRKLSYELGPEGLSVPSSPAPPVLVRGNQYESVSDSGSIRSIPDTLGEMSRPQTPLNRRCAVRRRQTAPHTNGRSKPDTNQLPEAYTSFPFPEPSPPHSPAAEELHNAWLGMQRPTRASSLPSRLRTASKSSANSR
ncbi:hypothetical protein F5Y11DRAFT_330257 [Daldinia sp. FL1419]|nr:hypothetical protein F5Y11DRAFT_330257 [Daldinia sp. FL1419]